MTLADNLPEDSVDKMMNDVNAMGDIANPVRTGFAVGAAPDKCPATNVDPTSAPGTVNAPQKPLKGFIPPGQSGAQGVKPVIPLSEKQADRNWEQNKDFTNQMIVGLLLLGAAYFMGRWGK